MSNAGMAESRQALEDVKVIGISQTVSGPACEAFLADFGADVIKVEPTGGGEPFRRSIHELDGEGFNMSFQVYNRNKRSVSIDLKSQEGTRVMYDLVADADIFVQNFAPGVVDRLELDYGTLSEYNEDLIYLSISGYGTEDEWADKPAFDNLIQQASGFSSLHRPAGQKPTMIKLWISDFFASYNAALSGLAALHHRENGGGGQKCEVSMFQSLAHTMNARYEKYQNLGEIPEPREPDEKAPLMNSIEETADGWIGIAFVPAYPNIWRGFCELLDREDLLDHPDYADPDDRRQETNLPDLNEMMREWLLNHDSETAVELLNDHGIPAAPHNSVPDAVEEGPARFSTIDHPRLGSLEVTETPLDLSETPPEISRPAPELGQHNDEVLSEIDYSAAEITELHEAGVLGSMD